MNNFIWARYIDILHNLYLKINVSSNSNIQVNIRNKPAKNKNNKEK